MAKFCLTLSLVTLAVFSEGAVTADETNPFADVARALLQESLSGNKGGNGENLGEALIGSLGNMLAGSGASSGSGGADLLSGIGSLLTASSSSQGGGGGGFDADTLGNFVDMLASGGRGGGGGGGIDMESLIGLASSVMAGQQRGGDGGGGAGLLNLLPLLLQTTNNQKPSGRLNPGAERARGNTVAEDDHQSPWSMLLPPLLAGLKEQWNNLWKSDAARKLLEESGLGATLSLFLDSEGRFDSERVMASLENAPFRRRWVRGAASFVARWAVYAAKPESRKRIISMATGAASTLLQSAQVLGDDSFDPTDLPIEETIARLVNVGARRLLGIQNLDSGIYINPAIGYIKTFLGTELSSSGRKGKGFGISAMLDALAKLSPRQVEDRLADAVNGELIEPALRVWRAYRFATRRPECSRYILCTINRQEEQEDGVSASQRKSKQAPRVGLKPVVTKVASLAAGWFLSNPAGTTFWKLYDAIMEENVCKVKYPGDCGEFHIEDQKATTEYAHNEL